MSYDEGLATRIREIVDERELDGIEEKHMFGGIAWMFRGNMAFGIIEEELMLRLGEERAAEALDEAHVRPMDFTGRPMKPFVTVEPAGFEEDEQLKAWMDRALAFAASLPPK